jgi:hypothetical protein
MDDTAHNKAVVAQFDILGNEGGDLAILDTLCTPDMVTTPWRRAAHRVWREPASF